MVDDVWSGGKGGINPETGKEYPLMSYAISKGLYHPRCRDNHSTYFPKLTKEELKAVGLRTKQEARQQYAERQTKKYERLAKHSLDEENQRLYAAREKQWRNVRFKTGGLSSKEYAESKRPLANFRTVPEDQVVGILRKDSEEWIKNLSKEECRAIRKYTYNPGDKKPDRFFERLNAMLRGDLPEDEKLREYAEIISRALKKNRLRHDVIAYRGTEIDPTEGVKIGGLFKAKQFYSTSVLEKRSFGCKYKLEIYVKKGAKAAYIERISVYKNQKELLLDKDCTYKVLSKRRNVIVIEVI